MKKVLRIIIMSTAICFLMTSALILINSILGIFIGLDYYFSMACVLTLCLGIGLILFDSKRIFSNKKRVSNKSNSNRTGRQKRQQSSGSRRKIS